MWFDVQLELAKIEGGKPPSLVQQPVAYPAPISAPSVAVVASVAIPPAQKLKTKQDTINRHQHGDTTGARQLTWTGRVVSLTAWRMLTEWEQHGPKAQHWSGITQSWEQPK